MLYITKIDSSGIEVTDSKTLNRRIYSSVDNIQKFMLENNTKVNGVSRDGTASVYDIRKVLKKYLLLNQDNKIDNILNSFSNEYLLYGYAPKVSSVNVTIDYNNVKQTTDIVVPDFVDSIGASYYNFSKANREYIKSIEFRGSGIKRILRGTFEGLKNLEKLKMGGIIYINDSCFKDCTSLKEVVVPEGCISIGSNAFADCINLERLVLPSTLKGVQNTFIANCPKLKEIECTGREAAKYIRTATDLPIWLTSE